jgi:hypothetical protein
MGWIALSCAVLIFLNAQEASSFAPAPNIRRVVCSHRWSLAAAVGNKNKRRRKRPPGSSASDPIKISQEKIEGLEDDTEYEEEDIVDELSPNLILQIDDVAKFEFKSNDITKGTSVCGLVIRFQCGIPTAF